jgi:hypothetical protein
MTWSLLAFWTAFAFAMFLIAAWCEIVSAPKNRMAIILHAY